MMPMKLFVISRVLCLFFALSAALAMHLSAALVAAAEPVLWADEHWGPLDSELAQEARDVRERCGQSDPESCGGLSLFYSRTAARLASESDKASSLYRLACADDLSWGCFHLAELARKGGLPAATLVVPLLEHACGLGESRACLELARILASGDGITVDLVRAEALYEAECESGGGAGCWGLGLHLLERAGSDHEASPSRARRYLERACTGGVADACFELGELCGREDCAQSRAAYYFGQACDRNSVDGCVQYANYLVDGRGLPEDAGFAAKLYRDACESDRGSACLELAELYRTGRGVARDVSEAAALERRACELGDPKGCERLGLAD